ncbi:minor capsid protein [Clostridium tyrobutyricum]|jgi:hypothetical protein|uniref:minor capsid protein n=1 Tax=Clostridium tyrobutyricum TaxID=1519 RepID=UPI0030CDF7A8
MATKVRVQMDSTQKILLKRSLNQNGAAQVKFTQECAKAFNNYVPFLTGRLKDMSVSMTATSISYNAPYARRQYYENEGKGKQGTSSGGMRGKLWDKRSWADNGDKIVKSIADFVGGRAG